MRKAVKQQTRDKNLSVRVPETVVKALKDLCNFTHLSQSRTIEAIVMERHGEVKKMKRR